MRQVVILVEGQTEEALVKEVLGPAASMRGTYVTPVVVTTSATPTGAHHGGGHWKHYHTQLQDLLKASHWHRVGLLLDYYQYPKGAPEREEATSSESLDSTGRQATLMAALRAEYPDPRFRPLVVLHEIEALVLAAIDAGQGDGLLPRQGLAELRQAITRAHGPEQVNDGPSTAPSKRLEAADPGYMKTVTGPLLVSEAGLPAVLERCPTFKDWWDDLLV
ncbi:DUF4276 family protein [Actinomyces oris]|uniref:DUF4276 family protein n=1 Tax=Actinomyces oris TaxID=544580 RepID=A0A1Q8I0N7_9ACTO|nr:DUF4276 family protein [Actinomyces oris]OLL14664.1 hypothetical protein BKH32_07350 [Actinomyces oris]